VACAVTRSLPLPVLTCVALACRSQRTHEPIYLFLASFLFAAPVSLLIDEQESIAHYDIAGVDQILALAQEVLVNKKEANNG
jgi:hypothetical protein